MELEKSIATLVSHTEKCVGNSSDNNDENSESKKKSTTGARIEPTLCDLQSLKQIAGYPKVKILPKKSMIRGAHNRF